MIKWLAGLLVVMCATGSLAAEYWPMMTGVELTYNTGVRISIVPGDSDGRIAYDLQAPTYIIEDNFADGGGGDIFAFGGWSFFDGGWDPDLWWFPVPVLFLDSPLFVGKTWSNHYYVDLGYRIWECTVTGTVASAGILESPLGMLDYLVVVIDGIPAPYLNGTYCLNSRFGPVVLQGGETITNATGIIASETTSWGALKALYR